MASELGSWLEYLLGCELGCLLAYYLGYELV